MTNLKLINHSNLPKDNEFLWRYFDIHTLLNILNQKRIRFTRMDQFEDALEGIPFETLEKFIKIKNVSTLNLACLTIEHNNKKANSSRLKIFGCNDNISKRQYIHYVSCWFKEQRESMAMWNLYSNSDGVALKITFGKLKEFLKPNSSESNIKDYFCGKVIYQDFRNQDPYSINGIAKLKKVSLRKDVSFSHEKEIRFVIKTNGEDSEFKLGIESESLNLMELDIKIICHPSMADWKKENVKQLLKDHNLLGIYAESEIKLRY